jgi:hypothetical protein
MCQCFRVRSQAGVHVDIQLDYWIAKQISPLGALEEREVDLPLNVRSRGILREAEDNAAKSIGGV